MSPNLQSPIMMTLSSCVLRKTFPLASHDHLCTQSGNGTSRLCFAGSRGSFPNLFCDPENVILDINIIILRSLAARI